MCVCVNASHIYRRSNCDINMQTISTPIQLKHFQKQVKPIFIQVFALKEQLSTCEHVCACGSFSRFYLSTRAFHYSQLYTIKSFVFHFFQAQNQRFFFNDSFQHFFDFFNINIYTLWRLSLIIMAQPFPTLGGCTTKVCSPFHEGAR